MSTKYERKIIILGKTGNGKSSLGNVLLGKPVFDQARGFNAVTTKCKLERVDGSVSVVDTPGLFSCDGERSLVKQALEVQKAIQVCPNPHAFLIVLNGSSRLTKEEMLTIDVLRIIFGEQSLKKAIIVLTHIENNMSEIELRNMLERNDKMSSLIEQCGGRFARIDNRNPNPQHKEDINGLVDQVSGTGKDSFKNEYIHLHTKVLREALESFDGGPVHEQIKRLSEQIMKAVEDKMKFNRKCLEAVGVGVGVVGGICLTLMAKKKIGSFV